MSVFVFGNPLYDMSANVDAAFLEKYGLDADNAILAEEKHMPLFDEIAKNETIKFIAGGSGQNTARVAQWLSKEAGLVSYAGCVGKDDNAESLEAAARADGVDVVYQVDETTPTGTCAALITGKDRSLVAALGAANNFKIDHLKSSKVAEKISAANYVYMTSFVVTSAFESAKYLAEQCSESGKTLIINLSAPFLLQFFKDQVFELVKHADYIFCNETEAAALGESLKWGDDLSVNAQKLADHEKAAKGTGAATKRVVCFTQGADPCIIATAGETDILKVDTPKLDSDKIVDLNGAGDSFVGGFIAELVQGKSLASCVAAGNFGAQTIIQVSGPDVPSTKPQWVLDGVDAVSIQKQE